MYVYTCIVRTLSLFGSLVTLKLQLKGNLGSSVENVISTVFEVVFASLTNRQLPPIE